VLKSLKYKFIFPASVIFKPRFAEFDYVARSLSKQIHRNNKIRLYKTLIKPVLCYGSVTWTFKADSHIAYRANAVPLPCRAAKGLECVFPI
jgi:hypothetical protein